VRVLHRTPSGDRILELEIDDPARPVSDLLRALGVPSPDSIDVVIDDCQVTADSPLSAVTMCEGSVVQAAPAPPAITASARTLTISGGVRAGVMIATDRRVVVGRGVGADLRIADPTLSPAHLSVTGSVVSDHESRNGTSVEGHALHGCASLASGASVRAGVTRLSLREPVDDRPVAILSALGAVGGTIPFNRPPRRAPVAEAPALLVPSATPPPPSTEPLSIAGIVLPVIAGAVVAILFSPFMAVFAALGPVLTVGTWWERRRRVRRARRAALRASADELTRLAAELPARRTAEIDRMRELHPDPAEVVRRATSPSVRCWERRSDHVDAFVVGIGGTDAAFRPELVSAADGTVSSDAAALVADQPRMPDVPIPVDLSAGHVVGLIGDRAASVAVARSLVLQLATHHGPADLAIVVGADDPTEWDWCGWLPHTTDHAAGRRGAHVLATTDASAADAAITAAGDRTVVAVLDGDDPFQGRATVGRRLLLGEHTSALVVVADAHRLPAGCDRVVSVDELGRVRVVDPRRAERGTSGLGWGLDRQVAAEASRRLARLDDPELPMAGAGVPASVGLLGLLGLSGDDPAEIEARWKRTDGSPALVAPIGADGDGPVLLDFVADGPHVLIGGTTGSGKSELLRSLVAAVGATADPDHVAMVLIDYKGGAAFDCCAELPHVAGLVTDLDDELAARALRCLDAELRDRERRLRQVGAEDLVAFRSLVHDRHADPLPRLLVVVDEFASLAADLPDFLDALVGIAQRGRSLGVHLVLATQRPAGVVTDDIRANAGCRIALRVTDRNESVDVIGEPEAAQIPRNRPGRAIARFGPGELAVFQSALSTGHSTGRSGLVAREVGAVAVDASAGEPNDLRRLVETIVAAHDARGGARPRPPWPPPLPDRVRRHELDSERIEAGHWLMVDEPDEQRRSFSGWRPADGQLVVVGGPGAGATTTLATAVLAVTRGRGAESPHIHIIDLDAGRLAPLAGLACVGTMVGPTDGVRRGRLVRWLDEEVTRRRGSPGDPTPPILVVIDDFAGLARAHDPVHDADIHERIGRIWAEGPAVGITIATSVRRSADLPAGLVATVGAVLLHRSADPSDGLRFSMKVSTERFEPGRAVRSGDGAVVQVVLEGETIEQAVMARSGEEPPVSTPHQVGELGRRIGWDTVTPVVEFDADAVRIEFGVRDRDLEIAAFRLHRREHALVLGPARSGRTNTLLVIARAAGDNALIVGDGPLARRSGLVPHSPTMLAAALRGRGPTLVLVDDCLDLDDPSGELAAIVASPPPGVHLIAAARPDRYRSAYGHWAADIRSSRVGILLRPEPIDGDLLGRLLPTRLGLAPVAGRGVVVTDGGFEIVQVVAADDQPSPS
jgi:DNA segregation ATPase FtsK/SpoIIIE, S-DNA-T family